MTNSKGFTLLELIITMALVIIVIMITGSAFESILKSAGQLVASEESNIEGVVGLEMFRHDLQQTGYGIPDTYQSIPPTYDEAEFAPANACNDAPSGVPRPIASLESIPGASDTNADDGATYSIMDGTDYLAIKASTVGRSKAAKKWTFLRYSAAVGTAFSDLPPNKWSNPVDNFKDSDGVIVLKRNFSVGGTTNTLIFNNNNDGVATIYWPNNPTVNMNSNFNPSSTDPTYFLYGIDDGDLGMPFNRADYFVANPSAASSKPATCAANTGILYKATVNHNGGKLNYMPLLDCVADMQVVFGWDVNSDGLITESSAYNSDVTKILVAGTAANTDIKPIMEDPIKIRQKLKYIKVYIMAQEGRRNANFKNTDNLVNNTYSVVVGDANTATSNASITKGYTAAQLAAKDWLNYRWKIYRIVVRPKNL